MTAEELLAQLEAEAQSETPVCIIDPDTRTITVPPEFQLLGVENDKRVERIYFQCPKIVGDNQDLSQDYQLFVNYQNANGDPDACHIDDMEVDGDNITFSWLLEENVTKYKGSIQIAFAAIIPGDEAEDPDKNRWNTTINTDCTVLTGLKCTQQVAESNPDALAQIWAAIDELKASGGGGGTPGKDGREIEIRNNGTAIQWRYVGDSDWTDLVQLSDLKGEGIPEGGTTGQVLTKNSNSNGDASWKNPSGVSDEQVKTAVNAYLEENPVQGGITEEQKQQLEQNTQDITDLKRDLNGLSLGVFGDKIYIILSGAPIGEGLDINEFANQYDTVVFLADFTGDHPKNEQFYTWDGRIYDGAIYDSLQNIQCSENTVKLKSSYDNENSRWIKQMMCTAGLFESDNFVCEFSAKFCGLAGSWNNVITYGTGTYWTDGMYSDGVKWPAGGEIDAFEQAGGYSDTPDKFTLAAHWGSGTTSGYPNTHSIERAEKTGTLSLDEWADYKFKVKNGIVSCYVNDELISSVDLSGKVVNNNYLYNYKPFLKPQAFYIDGSCASSGNDHTNNVYVFEVKDFKILQNEKVECNSLEIFPQMWEKGTSLKFPVESEIFFDKIFSPKDVSNKACTWESSEPLVATVTHGFVKTLKAGKTTITAKCGTATAQYELEVSNSPDIPCAGLEASSYNISGTEGSRIPLTLYKYPSFTTDSLENYSDDSEIAYFDNSRNEIVLASKGNTNIKINCGGKSVIVSCKVTSSFITGYDFTKSGGEDIPETYDIPDFVPGQTYTVSYKIGKLSTSNFYSRTILQPETGSTVIPPLVGYNTDGTIEVNAGSGSGIKITANVGDWVSIVFEVPISGSTHATVYVNGIEKEGVNPVVHKDYLVTNSSRRPYQKLRDNAQGYSSRVEVYYGDMHNLYVNE